MHVVSAALMESRITRCVGCLISLLCVVAVGGVRSAVAQRFLPDDPLWHDPDRMDMPLPEAKPSAKRIRPLEFLTRSFQGAEDQPVPAKNVNTVGGVPNSSWYTNRHYRFPMSREALQRGPNREPGPSRHAPWRVLKFPTDGALPKALVRDSTGRRFRVLFNAPAHPEMATGAAMISSRLLHALGYNVPQHWLRHIRAEQLVPHPDSGVTETKVDSLLGAAAQRPDGSYRALVTRIPEVERRIGPFRFEGTRSDDANDVFPHEDRRELRGLRVVAAWIQYTGIRPRHTLDVGVRVEGRRFVRHYLTDLHLTLGSAGAVPKSQWSGHEHLLEPERIFQRIGTLGLSGGEWAEGDSSRAAAIGHFEADGFDPRTWRQKWPNPAFRRAGPADVFWAAKKVRHFSRAELEAIVATAEYSSDDVSEYILRTLLKRRNAIGRVYLDWGGGLDQFQIRSGQLTFKDLRAGYGVAPDTLRRTVTWRTYDNQEEIVSPILTQTQSAREEVPVPNYSVSYLRATLAVPRVGTTHVFIRQTKQGSASPGGTLRRRVVGVDRTGPPSSVSK